MRGLPAILFLLFSPAIGAAAPEAKAPRAQEKNMSRWQEWAGGGAPSRAEGSGPADAASAKGPNVSSRHPFTFVYDGKPSDELLDKWRKDQRTETLDSDRTRLTTTWSDPETGLRVEWQVMRYADFPALEWLLFFENTGGADTAILESIQSLDLTFLSPRPGEVGFALHKTNGGISEATDFEPTMIGVGRDKSLSLGGGGGLSSNKDFPFFKIVTGDGSFIAAVGWSGQWQANLQCFKGKQLRVAAGLEKTHFRLHPGERVRQPRILALHWPGDTVESNAQFRQLIYKHYAAKRNGREPMPTLFCNTCFTRGGDWLNECNAENQIALIRACAPLGLEAIITDAGWFEGGWPDGAGSWTPKKDAYPDGMRPVARAAEESGMAYGLWFEPERVAAGTWIHKNHPEWLLGAGEAVFLANFGLKEVQDYFFGVVRGFMDLPGFRVYRQDFNIDLFGLEPFLCWQRNDAPDRQGMTEIRYIEGLYAFWDRIAGAFPDSLREECAGGGRRIDLETVMRFHIHQKTDYWFNNEVDQASLWGLSQYLPNNVFEAQLTRLDDYSFHSTLASSLCVGWAADTPGFDIERARSLADRYRQVRHLLTGAWYPLLPYSRQLTEWMASQYHRGDLNEGMILLFRHGQSPYRTAEVSLHGLDSEAIYELRSDSTGETTRATGAALMDGYLLTLPAKRQSELIIYRKAG